MKLWLIIPGLIIFLFSFYPPFHLMSFAIGLVVLLIGIFAKPKEKKDGH